jgi:hypothetical protein
MPQPNSARIGKPSPPQTFAEAEYAVVRELIREGKSLSDPKLGLENTVVDQVSEIHRVCPLPETHLRKI